MNSQVDSSVMTPHANHTAYTAKHTHIHIYDISNGNVTVTGYA